MIGAAVVSIACEAAAQDFVIEETTIAGVQQALQTNIRTGRQIVQAYFDRIAAYDRKGPTLNSIMTLNPRALAEADRLDAERATRAPVGPLHCVPLVLKDNYNTADLPTTGGSASLAGMLPPADAFVVAKLRKAGAIILGKSNMHEYALAYPGDPPALPGRQHKFDIYGGRPSPKLLIVSHHAHERKFDDGRVRKPKPQQVGVQISCCVHSQVSQEDTLWGVETTPRGGVSQTGAAKGKPDRRRAPDAGSRSHDDFDSAEIRGLSGGRIYQRQECDPFGPCIRGEEAHFVGQHFWARGYFVSTVGRDEAVIREYIRNQEQEDSRLDQMNLWR